jgi:hypothetical protein
MESALLDIDTLSEIMKGIDLHVQDHPRRYLALFRHFTFSIITRDDKSFDAVQTSDFTPSAPQRIGQTPRSDSTRTTARSVAGWR